MISENQIFLNQTHTNKEEVFRFLAEQTVALGIADSAQPVVTR